MEASAAAYIKVRECLFASLGTDRYSHRGCRTENSFPWQRHPGPRTARPAARADRASGGHPGHPVVPVSRDQPEGGGSAGGGGHGDCGASTPHDRVLHRHLAESARDGERHDGSADHPVDSPGPDRRRTPATPTVPRIGRSRPVAAFLARLRDPAIWAKVWKKISPFRFGTPVESSETDWNCDFVLVNASVKKNVSGPRRRTPEARSTVSPFLRVGYSASSPSAPIRPAMLRESGQRCFRHQP